LPKLAPSRVILEQDSYEAAPSAGHYGRGARASVACVGNGAL